MIQLTSPSGELTAVINPIGAALSELWFGEIQVAGSPDQYSGVPLFPWPNRIFDGTWKHDGEVLHFPINDSTGHAALHGLVFDKTFEFSKDGEGNCSGFYEFQPTEGYPFQAVLHVDFQLTDSQLNIVYRVTNQSADPMPFAIGFHPYFKASKSSVLLTDAGAFELSDVHVDDTLGPKLHEATLTTDSYTLRLTAPNTEYLHIFTNRYSNPDFIWFAIEPQTSPVDSLNTGLGVIKLAPGSSSSFNFVLKVD